MSHDDFFVKAFDGEQFGSRNVSNFFQRGKTFFYQNIGGFVVDGSGDGLGAGGAVHRVHGQDGFLARRVAGQWHVGLSWE